MDTEKSHYDPQPEFSEWDKAQLQNRRVICTALATASVYFSRESSHFDNQIPLTAYDGESDRYDGSR